MNPFFDKPEKKKSSKGVFLNILQSLVVVSAVFIVMYLVVVTPNQVDGPSMEPNFYNSQLLFTNKLYNILGEQQIGKSLKLTYQRGDVITFQRTGDKKALIKRVIGLPGERVSIKNGSFYINNQKLTEEYLPPATYTMGGEFIDDGGESVLVEEGSYFVAGDNRSVSRDSRSIGLIKHQWIKGKVILRFWPLKNFTLISRGNTSLE